VVELGDPVLRCADRARVLDRNAARAVVRGDVGEAGERSAVAVRCRRRDAAQGWRLELTLRCCEGGRDFLRRRRCIGCRSSRSARHVEGPCLLTPRFTYVSQIVVCTSERNEQTSHGFSKQDSPRERRFLNSLRYAVRSAARMGAEAGSLVRILTKEIECREFLSQVEQASSARTPQTSFLKQVIRSGCSIISRHRFTDRRDRCLFILVLKPS